MNTPRSFAFVLVVLTVGYLARIARPPWSFESHSDAGIAQGEKSAVDMLPITGGTPRRISEKAPSYWHSWSADGKTLAFVGQRHDEIDVYAIPAAGGEEQRLTTAKGLDDGRDCSSDGNCIYFNSERPGTCKSGACPPTEVARSGCAIVVARQ